MKNSSRSFHYCFFTASSFKFVFVLRDFFFTIGMGTISNTKLLIQEIQILTDLWLSRWQRLYQSLKGFEYFLQKTKITNGRMINIDHKLQKYKSSLRLEFFDYMKLISNSSLKILTSLHLENELFDCNRMHRYWYDYRLWYED